MNQENNQPHYLGHRKRLKQKFLNLSPASVTDYELLELLLFQSIPRKDVKPLAKRLLQTFSDFNEIFNSEKNKILGIEGVNEPTYLQFKLLREILNRVFHNKIKKKNVISSWCAVVDYLKFNMSNLKIEQFRILFLNKKNILIADEIISTGTIDQTPIYPREVVKKALLHEAGAIILVHNHPSGGTKPSRADIDLTNQLVTACSMVNITVHDHIIIGGSEYYSFKSNMLL